MADLLQDPGRFEFHQALRLLEGRAVPGIAGAPLGVDHAPASEVARLRTSTSLGFPTNAIESIQRRSGPAGGAAKVEVAVGFAGALGACGTLPWHYTEYVYECLSRRDRSFRDFVDTLEHRSLAFFHRAWQKYRLPFAYEVASRRAGTDDVTFALWSLVGLGTEGLRERLAETADPWVYFAGLFARRQRTTAGLEAMLHAVCGHAVGIQEFVGRWEALLPEERSRLGDATGECRNALGSSLILGERVWDTLSGVRIRIGPIDSRALAELSPRTGRFSWLGPLVRSYLGPDIDFEIVGIVEQPTIRPLQLGAGSGASMGCAAWINSSKTDKYDSEVPICAFHK
jgi:type VI secretion system protein ImpH